jgi:hypothetical protein
MTASGRAVNPFTMEPKDVLLSDIGRALSNTCRWGGHLPPGVWISVAQHSVWVKELLEYIGVEDESIISQGLLHDASEAYVGDMVSPFKEQVAIYNEVEHKVQSTIAKAFGIPHPWDPIVHWADKAVMVVLESERAGKNPAEEVFSGYLENALTAEVWRKRFYPGGIIDYLQELNTLWTPGEAYANFMRAARTQKLIEKADRSGGQ